MRTLDRPPPHADARVACQDPGVDPGWFFPPSDQPQTVRDWFDEMAKATCGRCQVQEDCLTWAVETGIEHGTWGGATEQERRAAGLVA